LAGAGLAEQKHRGVAGGDAAGGGGEGGGGGVARGRGGGGGGERGGGGRGAKQLGGEGIAEIRILGSEGETGRRGSGGAHQSRGAAEIDDEVVGGDEGFFPRGEDGEPRGPAVARGEDRGIEAGAGQPCRQRRI